MYKNPTDVLVGATKLPAAIELRLPAGAPKISATLVDFATRLPKLPDFPMEIPALPDIPVMMPAALTPTGAGYISGVTVMPVQSAMQSAIIPSPAVGVLPEVIQRRGF